MKKIIEICRFLPVMVLGGFLFVASSVYAETIYLNDGTILRGAIKSEDEKTLLIETGDTWKRIDKSKIEHINKDTENSSQNIVPAEKQAETAGQSNQSTSRPVVDLRIRLGSAAQIDEAVENGTSYTLTGKDSSNVQIDFNLGIYGQSKVGLILSAGLFARNHAGYDNPVTVEYDASGISLGAGVGIKPNDHVHFEGKLELGFGSGNATLSATGYAFNQTEAGGYVSASIILGAYLTVSKPGFQIGLELGSQSFTGTFRARSNSGVWWNETVNGTSGTANLVAGIRF